MGCISKYLAILFYKVEIKTLFYSHKMGNSNSKCEEEKGGKIQEKTEPVEFPGPWKNEKMLFDTNIKAKRIIEVEGNVLDLKSASLYLTPPSLCSRTELKELNLSLNPIKQHFTDGMTKLTNLETLIITECYFNSIPIPMTKMISLRVLDLSKNNISSSYRVLRSLTNLEELYLNHCGLRSFTNIDTLVNLKVLELSYNHIYGSISSIGFMVSLERLIISKSGLSHFKLQTNKLDNLKYLDTRGNNLSKYGDIGNILNLQTLLLDSICDKDLFNSLDNLEELYIEQVEWYSIPESLCNLSKLRFLKMYGKLGVLNDNLHMLQNLQELSLQSSLLFYKFEMIGCTILKLTNDDFDIKSLFPHLSDEMIEDIKFKETANICPDLSCLQSLNKLSYTFEGNTNLIEVRKVDEKWIVLNKDSPSKNIEIEYKFKPAGEFYVGRNGIFILMQESLFKYSQESEEQAEKIDIVEINTYKSSVFIRDIENRIWKCRYIYHPSETFQKFAENIIGFSKILEKGSSHSFFGISSDGSLYDLGMQECTKICENIFKIYGNNINSLCVNENGQLVEIYGIGTPNEQIIHIDDIPNIKGGVVYEEYGGFNSFSLCIDEIGNLWIKGTATGYLERMAMDKKWEQTKLSGFTKMVELSYEILFLTDLGEIMFLSKRNIKESINSEKLKKLPLLCNNNRFSHIKSARK